MSSELENAVLRGGNAAGRWGCVIMRRRGLAVARCGCGVEPCGGGRAAVRRSGAAGPCGGVVYENDDNF